MSLLFAYNFAGGTLKKKIIGDTFICFCLCCLIAFLIVFSADAKVGAKKGIGLCEGIIIPSLLPVLIIGNTITNSRLRLVFDHIFNYPFKKLFALPKESCSAVILGLVCGYPAGAALTESLFERKAIDAPTAQRIMSFNFCGGAAFTITAVGAVVYGNIKSGVVFYIISILSSLTVAFITRFLYPKSQSERQLEPSVLSLSDAFCFSVERTVKSLALMCAYIILFSSVFSMFSPPKKIIPLLEITNGVCGDITFTPAATVFFLSFGGLCVHAQLFSALKKMEIKYIYFLAGRLSCALLSYLYFKIYSFIFPESDTVFNNINSPSHGFSSGGITLSMLMIIGCAVIVFDIENRKIKLRKQ